MRACYIEEPLGEPGAGKEGPAGKAGLSIGRWPVSRAIYPDHPRDAEDPWGGER